MKRKLFTLSPVLSLLAFDPPRPHEVQLMFKAWTTWKNQ